MNEELTTVRSLDTIAAEIRALTASMLSNVIEIGRRMVEAKDVVPYGQFGDWLRENTGYSTSTANNFMRIFAEYGDPQKSLFGTEPLCQTFGKLSYSKALALLSVPAEERESFAVEVDAEHLSTRELKEAIAQRDEALRALEEERQNAEGAETEISDLQADLDIERDKVEDLKARLRKEKENADELARQVEELENRPTEVAVQEPSQEDIDRAVAEAMKTIEAQHAEQLRQLRETAEADRAGAQKLAQQLKEVRDKLKTANAGGAEKEEKLRAEIDRLNKALAMSDSTVTAFRLYFSAWQAAYKNMIAELAKVAPETQEKLRAAVSAQMSAWKGAEE